MLEALKKRFNIGDLITIYTNESSFTGKIDDFETNFIVLETDESVEFIAYNTISRFSALKSQNNINNLKSDLITESKIESTIIPISKIVDNDFENETQKTVELEPREVKSEIKPITEYKVGEIIPLVQLDKISQKKHRFPNIEPKVETKSNSLSDFKHIENSIQKKQILPISGSKLKTKFSSFAELEQLISTEIEEENKKTVSANGVITTFFANKSFGFITNKFGNDIWFSFQNIVDNDLLGILIGIQTKANIPILFTLTKNSKGNVAICIQKPKKVEDIANLAKSYYEKDKFDIALTLISQILFTFPENRLALKLKGQIESNILNQRGYSSKPTFKSFDFNYQKATSAKNTDKNFDEALKYYMLALENNEKRESCIKDIAMLLVSMGEIQKAIEFMNKYVIELHENITTYNYLANFYSSVKEFDKVIDQIDLLLEEKYIIKDKIKLSMYLSQKGFALIQLNDLESARDVLEEAVGLHKDNTYANRLLIALDETDVTEFDKLVNEAEFETLGGGVNRIIQDIITNYSEFHGIPSKIVEIGEYTQKTLKEIRKLIEGAGKARPKERANYLLSEAKLMQQLEPDNEEELRSVLARYCNAMALNSIYEKYSMDIARTYYSEAFNLEDNWDSVKRQFILFVISLKNIHSDLLSVNTNLSGKEISNQILDEIIKTHLNTEKKEVWDNILLVFILNKSILSNTVKFLFKNDNVRKSTIAYLQGLNFQIDNNVNIDIYMDIWNQAREKRQRDYSRWHASIKSIYANENLEVLTNQLSDSLNEARKNWLSQLDTSRLTVISTDILDVLNQYLRQSGYRDKERFFGFAKAQVNQLMLDIKEKPTKFSYEGFIPLLEKIDILLEKSFKSVDSASTPIVKVSILGEASIVAIDKTVPLKLFVENSKESSPIRDIVITIQGNNEISPCDKIEYFDTIDGGESCELHARVKVSDNVLKDRATTLEIICTYKKRNQDEPVIIKEQLSLRLYSEEEFEIIPNPYEKLANGGPVTDTTMFYGRNEFIERITQAIILADSKQVVIYGQKRSGKSSVLYHLKKSLENTGQTFCISFSIGDIYETVSSATFFYKILSLIEEEIENISFKGKETPTFKCPPFSEFKDNPNPADLFRKHIRTFKRSCSLLEEWKLKKLVVMIDEFTYLYTAIKTNKVSDALMKQWKAITQNEDSMFSSVLVGQDVFPMFKDDFPNEFGITQDERLTYLSKSDALRLIEEPIGKTKTNRNRFIGNALDTIIDYTSCNPYYIQIFCARLVSEMNRKKYIEVTNADVKEISDSFINGGQALTDDKFDNLLNAGEKYDIQKISKEESKAILRKIATNAMNIGFCLREQISFGNPEREDEILKDLVKREVLEQKGDSYKIQVKLFQEWLLKH